MMVVVDTHHQIVYIQSRSPMSAIHELMTKITCLPSSPLPFQTAFSLLATPEVDF